MSAGHQASSQQSSSTWTEPPWSGWIETTGDALLILEAARRGLIPRVTRRLVDSERKMITSGSVFVFDEDESGIKRWTDGFFWSPSRILGNFLLYRETDKRGAGHRGARTDPDPNEYTDSPKSDPQSLSRPKNDGTTAGVDKHRERSLMGSLTNSYKFKPDGLMKKTFSLTISGVSQHLISYYKIEDVENGRLRSPSSLPELASLDISPEYLDKTHFRNPPKVEVGADGVPRYRGEADDIDDSPSLLPAPLSSGMPLLTEGRATESSSSKRAKRFDPFGSPPVLKRTRKNTKSSLSDASSPPTPVSPEESHSPTTPQASTSQAQAQPQPPAYPEANSPVNVAVAPTPAPAPYPAYSVQGFFPVQGYHPPLPPGHIFAAAPPPPPQVAYALPPPAVPPGSTSPPTPQQGVAVQYAYPGYPPHGSDPSQAGHAAHSFYPGPYYAHPHQHQAPHPLPGYAPYQGVPWPPYSGYPPPPQPHSHHVPQQYPHAQQPAAAQQPQPQPPPEATGSGGMSGEEGSEED